MKNLGTFSIILFFIMALSCMVTAQIPDSKANYETIELLSLKGTSIGDKLLKALNNPTTHNPTRERLRAILDNEAKMQLLGIAFDESIEYRNKMLESEADIETINESGAAILVPHVSGVILPPKSGKNKGEEGLDILRNILDVQATVQLLGEEGVSQPVKDAIEKIVTGRVGDKDAAQKIAEKAYHAVMDSQGYIAAKPDENFKDRLNRIANIQLNGGSGRIHDTQSNKDNSKYNAKATQGAGTGQGGSFNGQGDRPSDSGLNQKPQDDQLGGSEGSSGSNGSNGSSGSSGSSEADVATDESEFSAIWSPPGSDRAFYEGTYQSPNGSSDPYNGKHAVGYIDRGTGGAYCVFDDGTQRGIAYTEDENGIVTPISGSSENNQSNAANGDQENSNESNSQDGNTSNEDNNEDEDDEDDDDDDDDKNADTSTTETDKDEESDQDENNDKDVKGTPDPEKNQGKRSSIFEKTDGRMGGQDHRNQEKALEHQKSGKGTIDPNPDGGQTPGGVFKIEASARDIEMKLALIAGKGTNSTPSFDSQRSSGHTKDELDAIQDRKGATGAPVKKAKTPPTGQKGPIGGQNPPAGPLPNGKTLVGEDDGGDDGTDSTSPSKQLGKSNKNILRKPTVPPQAGPKKSVKDTIGNNVKKVKEN